MTKRKSILSFILAICLIVPCAIMLSACGSEEEKIHTHTFATEWTSDANYHWHAATCEHTDEISEKAVHTWDEGVVTTAPTATDTGVKTFTCTICEKTKTETVAALGAATGTSAFNESYSLNKEYNGLAVAEPTASNYSTNSDGAVTIEWLDKDADNKVMDSAPINAGSYTLKINVAATSNFTATSCSLDFTITARAISGTFSPEFTYNGDETHYIDLTTSNNVLEGDVNAIQIQVVMNSKNVGASIVESATYVVGEMDCNYSILSSQVESASIVRKAIKNFVLNQEYSGFRALGNNLSATNCEGLVTGDQVSCSVMMTSKNVGATIDTSNSEPIQLTGNDAGNYSLEVSEAHVAFVKKAIKNATVTKVYDGTSTFITGSVITSSSICTGDTVKTRGTYMVDSQNVGTQNTREGYCLIDTASDVNYTLAEEDIKGIITKKVLSSITVQQSSSILASATTDTILLTTTQGIVGGDVVEINISCTGLGGLTAGSYNIVPGPALDESEVMFVSLTGTSAGNYELDLLSTNIYKIG